jgi:hypothetical protein
LRETTQNSTFPALRESSHGTQPPPAARKRVAGGGELCGVAKTHGIDWFYEANISRESTKPNNTREIFVKNEIFNLRATP